MKFNIFKSRSSNAVLLLAVILAFITGCEKETVGPEPQKVYTEYGSVIKQGLIAYYPFDGNVKDYSGSNYNGLDNELSFTIGRFGQQTGAVHFDGVKDFIEIPSFFNSDSGTICFWVRTKGHPDENNEAAVFSKIGTGGNGYVLSVHGRSDFWFNYKMPYVQGGESTYIRSIDTTNYIFVAITFTSTQLTYFSEGYPTIESTLVNGKYVFNNNSQSIFLGKSLISKYNLFEGDIDDLLIYNRALKHDEILKLCNWK